MNEIREKLETMVKLMGFNDFRVEEDDGSGRIAVFINDKTIPQDKIPFFVLNLNRVARLISKQLNGGPILIDINNYRREREGLIIKLARAAATKASVTGEPIQLPAMNAYERRLIHAELSMRPDVKTESIGERYDRHVVVKPI